MSRDSLYDQFVCRMWFTRRPLWCLLVTSTYGILLTALERYVAVVHHIWYKVKPAGPAGWAAVRLRQSSSHFDELFSWLNDVDLKTGSIRLT